MNTITIIHNPRCSKSREALALIESHGYKAHVVDYLNGGLTRDFLLQVIRLLNVRPKELLRTKEDEFKSLNLDLEDNSAVINSILRIPKLLERPIAIRGNHAVIGRPPENLLTLLKN